MNTKLRKICLFLVNKSSKSIVFFSFFSFFFLGKNGIEGTEKTNLVSKVKWWVGSGLLESFGGGRGLEEG